jgi:hypothetical protein
MARASNLGGTTAMRVRDRLDGLWRDEDFAGRYPRDGRPGHSPAQLATVSVQQFRLGLSDRDAAEAVRCLCATESLIKSPVDEYRARIFQEYHDGVHKLGAETGMDFDWGARTAGSAGLAAADHW